MMNRRGISVVPVALCLVAGACTVQYTETYGLKGGVTLATATDDWKAAGFTDARIGPTIGMSVEAQFGSGKVSETGIYYMPKGGTGTYAGFDDAELRLDYLELPLWYRIGIGDRAHVALGVSLGLIISAEVEAGGSTVDLSMFAEDMDVSLLVGTGTKFGKGSANVIYTLGIKDWDKSLSDGMHRNLSFLVGTAF